MTQSSPSQMGPQTAGDQVGGDLLLLRLHEQHLGLHRGVVVQEAVEGAVHADDVDGESVGGAGEVSPWLRNQPQVATSASIISQNSL